VIVSKGSAANLSCSGSGSPTPDVKWTRNNQIVAGGFSQANYTITAITIDQGGDYVCVVSNKYGSDRKTTRVFVLRKY
jgi:hypothetical protein